MDYHEEFIVDFAKRTRANLEFIEAAKEQEKNVFEVTQLANSLLGLLVFPREYYLDDIPETPLKELVQRGWPTIQTTLGRLPQETLRELMRMLRNSIAHCNVTFRAADSQIVGLRVWNTKPGSKEKTWEAELTIDDLRTIALKFIELIEDSDRRPS